MRIQEVDVVPLSYVTDEKPPRHRGFALTRIRTDDGRTGWGESSDAFGHGAPLTLQALVREHIQGRVVGRPVSDRQFIVSGLAQELYRHFGYRGLLTEALSGLEIALWDLHGQAVGRSISDLLGRQRDHVPIYASGAPLFDVPVDDVVDYNRPLLEQGARAVKVRTGNHLEWDLDFVRACPAAFGADITLFVDGKYNYTLDSAVTMSRVLHDAGFSWFEEPIPDYRPDDIARLRSQSPIPIAYGEHCFTRADFQILHRLSMADIWQPDPMIGGGLQETLRIVQMGTTLGYRVVPHCAGMTTVGLAAGIHLAAALEDLWFFEYDSSPHQPLRDDLSPSAVVRPHHIEDGLLPVPDGPGLGIEIDDSVLEQYAYEPRPDLQRTSSGYGIPTV